MIEQLEAIATIIGGTSTPTREELDCALEALEGVIQRVANLQARNAVLENVKEIAIEVVEVCDRDTLLFRRMKEALATAEEEPT